MKKLFRVEVFGHGIALHKTDNGAFAGITCLYADQPQMALNEWEYTRLTLGFLAETRLDFDMAKEFIDKCRMEVRRQQGFI